VLGAFCPDASRAVKHVAARITYCLLNLIVSNELVHSSFCLFLVMYFLKVSVYHPGGEKLVTTTPLSEGVNGISTRQAEFPLRGGQQ
jgi:hypothetical protein